MKLDEFVKTFEKGGPGSGNHQHSGRPGERGGSTPPGDGHEDTDYSEYAGLVDSPNFILEEDDYGD